MPQDPTLLKFNIEKPSTIWSAGALKQFFTNSEPIYCPVTKCGLYETDCATPLNQKTKISMEDTAPWSI